MTLREILEQLADQISADGGKALPDGELTHVEKAESRIKAWIEEEIEKAKQEAVEDALWHERVGNE